MKRYKIVLFILVVLSFVFCTSFTFDKSYDYNLNFDGKEKTITCYKDDKGILIVPLQDIAEMIGYTVNTCSECNLDKLYNLDEIKAHNEIESISTRKMFIEWDKNIVTSGIDSKVILLDTENKRVNGKVNKTYTSLQLYKCIGFDYELDESKKSIVLNKSGNKNESTGGNSKTGSNNNVQTSSDESKSIALNKSGNMNKSTGSDSKTDINNNVQTSSEDFKIREITYVSDPNCTSCKETTALLGELKKKFGIDITTIDSSEADSTNKIQTYYKNSSVPSDIQNVFPIVFIGDQYLFNVEITQQNIEKLLIGDKFTHSIEKVPSITANPESIENKGNTKIQIIYFYSPTCASCRKAEKFVTSIKENYPDVDILKYSISDSENMKLLKKYAKYYNLPDDKAGNIPAVFISDSALVGDKEIIDKLESIVKNFDTNHPTPELTLNDSEGDNGLIDKSTLKFATVFGAGLVNGINPCSLSMFLFLLSLLVVERKKMLKVGIAFCLGKFVMFFLLGTILYRVFSIINIDWMNSIVKVILLIVIFAFVVLNLNDFIAARMEKYNKIILQLPSSVRGIYQGLMKKIANYSESKYVVLIMALLGMLLALGEFICTGQIYLSAIVFLVQNQGSDIIPVLYLVLYSFAFIVPLLIITILIYFGNKVFNLSEKLLLRLPIIKVISAMLFLIFGIYIIFFM